MKSALVLLLLALFASGCAGEEERLTKEEYFERGLSIQQELDELAEDIEAGQVACGMEWNRRAYGLESTDRAQTELAELQDRGYQFRSR